MSTTGMMQRCWEHDYCAPSFYMFTVVAEHGAVLVSPCISPGEKEIARAALEAGRPLIVLLENGFAPLYKPRGVTSRLASAAAF
ncbi:MAG: hypothetical protein ACOYOU_16415 [Kiritimatiellia bacterium]